MWQFPTDSDLPFIILIIYQYHHSCKPFFIFSISSYFLQINPYHFKHRYNYFISMFNAVKWWPLLSAYWSTNKATLTYDIWLSIFYPKLPSLISTGSIIYFVNTETIYHYLSSDFFYSQHILYSSNYLYILSKLIFLKWVYI